VPGAILARAARLWSRSALSFTLVAALEAGPSAALWQRGAALVAPLGPEAGLVQWVRTFLLVNLFAAFTGALAEGAIVLGVLEGAAGRRSGPLRLLAGSSERYGRLLAVNGACTALATGAFLLMPPLAVLVQSLTFLALPAALAEPSLSVVEVLRRSFALLRRRWPFVFLLVLFTTILEVGADQLLGRLSAVLPSAPAWAQPVAEAVSASLLGGFVVVVATTVYAAYAAAPPPAAWGGFRR
jgi:hypothetical protein